MYVINPSPQQHARVIVRRFTLGPVDNGPRGIESLLFQTQSVWKTNDERGILKRFIGSRVDAVNVVQSSFRSIVEDLLTRESESWLVL